MPPKRSSWLTKYRIHVSKKSVYVSLWRYDSSCETHYVSAASQPGLFLCREFVLFPYWGPPTSTSRHFWRLWLLLSRKVQSKEVVIHFGWKGRSRCSRSLVYALRATSPMLGDSLVLYSLAYISTRAVQDDLVNETSCEFTSNCVLCR